MDRKTLFSSLFAATIVAAAGVKTAVDPDLRGLFVRMVCPEPRPMPPVVREDRPRPSEWPQGLELVVDPELIAPARPWGTGESYCDAEEPWAGETRMVALVAVGSTGDSITLWFNVGNICRGQTFAIQIDKAVGSAPTVVADADWWSDLGPVLSVDGDGHTVERWMERDELGDVVGRVAIDSLDWAPERDIAVKLALGCAFTDSPARWLWIEGGGTVTVQQLK